MDHISFISSSLNLPSYKVKNTIDLLNNDNTIPFIARYRKEVTGDLDEVQIRDIAVELKRLVALDERRETIFQSIQSQGLLTEALAFQIKQAGTLTELEDLYLPYRPKRRTRAMIAREKGLEPLANLILEQHVTDLTLEEIIKPFINDEVENSDAAIAGACDIVAEIISESAAIRQKIRENGLDHGKLTSELKSGSEDQRRTYETYYQFELPVKHLRPHQILAINRGEHEGVLRVGFVLPDRDWQLPIETQFPINRQSIFAESLQTASSDSAKRLLLPAIERDIRRYLSENAEEHAISIFADNLKALLTQPPLSGYIILAIDPGFRTGSKIVVVDSTGKLLDFTTIYPHPPQNQKSESIKIIEALIRKYQVSLIVIGNGTASRETELLVAEIIKSNPSVNYMITSEAGASVYSASDLARKEFPDLDVTIRGAISIARRVQDPLAELVKIDPKAIGVGMYQHDVDQKRLAEALDQVVESVVNAVGVEVNTASAPLLMYVAGIGKKVAENIVQFREDNGPFLQRTALLGVPGLGVKTFEQAAGFLRIRNGSNPLDRTAIHPESYPIAERLYKIMSLSPNAASDERIRAINHLLAEHSKKNLSKELQVGIPTMEDILAEIARPGRDPREALPKPILRKDVLSMKDLTTGMEILGTIRNVVDFGVFVDIGVKTDGLLHRSKIGLTENLKVGDILNVVILTVDEERQRISLGLKESKQS